MIIKLVMEQFGPFRGRVELNLAEQGLILVKGRVEVSAAADSNGAGKTSIVHALSWGLFGEDLAGRRADAVACRFTEGTCLVRIEMDDALGEWGVLRCRRPASLSVWGIPGVSSNEDASVLQEKVEQRLGFGPRTFRNAAVFGQGHFERFAGADQAEQMRMLDEIQGVDFREALARAKEWRAQLQQQHAEADMGTRDLAVRRSALLESIARATLDRDSFETTKAAHVWRMREAAAAAESQVLALCEEVRRVKAAEPELARLKLEQSKADALDPTRLYNAAKSLETDAKIAEAAQDDLARRLSDLVERGACPTCFQPVKARQKQVRKLFEPALTRLSTLTLAAQARWKRAADAYDAASDKYAKQLAHLGSMTPGGEDVTKYVARLENLVDPVNVRRTAAELDRAKEVMRRTDDEFEKATLQEWHGHESLAAAQAELSAVQAALSAAEPRIAKLLRAIEMAHYWVEAFGDRGIRSLLVDGVADFVNERMAAHLEALAAGEATTRMSAQTDFKKGGFRERISFRTEWTWGGAGPNDGSGGQDRRKDLALFAAMQDLAESRSARPFPIKVFDEPFDALDSRGKELAVEWVRRAAQDRGTALLVTHSEELAAMVEPDRTWTVVMGQNGARVEVS